MKWIKNGAATIALIPALYLASCGSGNNEKDKQDNITTQSPPPAQVNPPTVDMNNNSYDSGSSRISAGTDASANKEATGNTSAKRKTEIKKSSTYHHSYTASKSSFSRKKSSKPPVELTHTTPSDKTGAGELERITDTAASKLRKLGDTTAKKIREITDTAAKKMDRLADTTAHHLQKLGDSSTMPMHQMMMGDSSSMPMHQMMMGDSSSMPMHHMMMGDSSTEKTPAHGMTDSSGKKSTMDTGINFSSSVFIPDQIRSNYAEIKMARMAIEKSQNDAVKQVATTLENDHNSLLRELQTMARNSINGADSIPTSENDMAKQHMDMMKNMTGQEFDQQWLQHMHMMHDQKIQMFEQAEINNSIHDAELRIWVEKTLPTLRKHRDMLAQTLNAINK